MTIRGTGFHWWTAKAAAGAWRAKDRRDERVMYESRESSMYVLLAAGTAAKERRISNSVARLLCRAARRRGRDGNIAERWPWRWRKGSDEAPVNQMMSAVGARSSTAMTNENRLHRIYRKCWKFRTAIRREHAAIELAFAPVDCRQTGPPEQHRTSNRRGARFRWVWPIATYTVFLRHTNNV
ncbi:hypothetical protein B0H13DRAFT_1864266 [Mycena leptocephala]|nr:hypothetical protein B0H13DRAFT_1864266 [Mycena leptocephala]